jgi:LemA protein
MPLLVLGVSLGLFLVVGLALANTYNRLVKLRNRCDNGFSQIEVQLKRRYDLIPNLVECVRGYLSHERDTLESVIAARNRASQGLARASQNPSDNSAVNAWMGSEGQLAGALGRLNFVMEAYPELKANENVSQLSEELSHTENRVAFARQAYNDLVMAFNTYRQSFPTVVLAGMFGYSRDLQMIEFADREALQQTPEVSFV